MVLIMTLPTGERKKHAWKQYGSRYHDRTKTATLGTMRLRQLGICVQDIENYEGRNQGAAKFAYS